MLIPRKVGKALDHATDKDSCRYAIGALNIERDQDGKPCAVATDGRLIVVAEWQEPAESGAKHVPGFQALVDPAHLRSADKATKATPAQQSRKPLLGYLALGEVNANGHVMITSSGSDKTEAAEYPTTDGRFPGWRSILGSQLDDLTGTVVRLDARYLKKLADALLAVAPDDTKAYVDLWVDENPARAVKFRAVADDRYYGSEPQVSVRGLLMPVARD